MSGGSRGTLRSTFLLFIIPKLQVSAMLFPQNSTRPVCGVTTRPGIRNVSESGPSLSHGSLLQPGPRHTYSTISRCRCRDTVRRISTCTGILLCHAVFARRNPMAPKGLRRRQDTEFWAITEGCTCPQAVARIENFSIPC